MDRWEIEANAMLFRYLRRRTAAGTHYCCEDTRLGLRSAHHPSPLTARLTAPLVAYKRAWAQDMREADVGEGVPVEVQRAAWRDCMERAEAEVQRVRAGSG